MRIKRILPYILICLALLPVMLLRDFTPSNELRYLSIAEEALKNHTFFAFTNHGIPYADKPPLYIWIVMLCKVITGTHSPLLLSLFSLIPALVIVRIMDRWAADDIAKVSGMWLDHPGAVEEFYKIRSSAALMLFTNGYFLASAIVMRMDMLMCMFIVLSLRSFWRMYQGNDPCRREEYEYKARMLAREKWLFPIYTFLALFTKGPVGLLVPLLSTIIYLALTRRIREIGRYWGARTWLVLAIACILWFGAAYLEGGSSYIENLLVHQTVDRAVNAFHHQRPFYYYAIVIWYCLAPWTFLVLGIVIASLRLGFLLRELRLGLLREFRLGYSRLQGYFLTIALVTFVMLSCFSSKLQIYLLPSFAFFVYAAVIPLNRIIDSTRAWLVRLTIGFPAVIFMLGLPAVVILARMESTTYLNYWVFYAAGAVLTLAGLLSLYFLVRFWLWDAILLLATGLLLGVFVAGWGVPRLNPEIGYGCLAEKALEVSQTENVGEFCTWNVKRSENMDVYLHASVRNLNDEELAVEDFPRPCVLMLRAKDLPQFPGENADIVGDYAVITLQDNEPNI